MSQEDAKHDPAKAATEFGRNAAEQLSARFPNLTDEDHFRPLCVAMIMGANAILLADAGQLDEATLLAHSVTRLVEDALTIVVDPEMSSLLAKTRFHPWTSAVLDNLNYLVLKDFSRFDVDAIEHLSFALGEDEGQDRKILRGDSLRGLPKLSAVFCVVDGSHDDRSRIASLASNFSIGIVVGK